jgi:hypothetical protein
MCSSFVMKSYQETGINRTIRRIRTSITRVREGFRRIRERFRRAATGPQANIREINGWYAPKETLIESTVQAEDWCLYCSCSLHLLHRQLFQLWAIWKISILFPQGFGHNFFFSFSMLFVLFLAIFWAIFSFCYRF